MWACKCYKYIRARALMRCMHNWRVGRCDCKAVQPLGEVRGDWKKAVVSSSWALRGPVMLLTSQAHLDPRESDQRIAQLWVGRDLKAHPVPVPLPWAGGHPLGHDAQHGGTHSFGGQPDPGKLLSSLHLSHSISLHLAPHRAEACQLCLF